MKVVIVPNELRDAINRKLDAAIEQVPDAKKGREVFYEHLLGYYDEHGIIPDFDIVPADA